MFSNFGTMFDIAYYKDTKVLKNQTEKEIISDEDRSHFSINHIKIPAFS